MRRGILPTLPWHLKGGFSHFPQRLRGSVVAKYSGDAMGGFAKRAGPSPRKRGPTSSTRTAFWGMAAALDKFE